jgi:hypothetical protein
MSPGDLPVDTLHGKLTFNPAAASRKVSFSMAGWGTRRPREHWRMKIADRRMKADGELRPGPGITDAGSHALARPDRGALFVDHGSATNPRAPSACPPSSWRGRGSLDAAENALMVHPPRPIPMPIAMGWETRRPPKATDVHRIGNHQGTKKDRRGCRGH